MADDKKQDAKPAEPLAGGPGVESEPAPAPKFVTVKHGGRELQVPEDLAGAWQEREREFETRIGKQGQELGELRKWRQQAEAAIRPQPAQPAEPDINTLWFENPQAAYQKIKQDVREEITSDYRRDQALRSFWDGFYRGNDDLREDAWVAETVFRDNFQDLADMPTSKAQEKLADLTREKILRLTRKAKTEITRAPMLESASGDRPPRPQRDEDEDDGPKTMGELIAQRRARRMAVGKK